MARILVAVLTLILLITGGLVGCGDEYYIEAHFSADPSGSQAPVEVQFNDQSLGDIDTWEWDFDNDGVVDSTLQNPKHTYSAPGNYTIVLKVSGPGGNDTEVMVDYLRIASTPCEAGFTAEPREITGRKPVYFTDQSIGDITSWEWDFNEDGVIDATVQNPKYLYSKDGVYSITLTITTPDCEDTLTKTDYITATECRK